jgi:hypothetical protein
MKTFVCQNPESGLIAKVTTGDDGKEVGDVLYGVEMPKGEKEMKCPVLEAAKRIIVNADPPPFNRPLQDSECMEEKCACWQPAYEDSETHSVFAGGCGLVKK